EEGHEVGGIRHRKCGAAHQRDRKIDLPRRRQTRGQEQNSKQQGARKRMREERHEIGEADDNYRGDIQLRCQRQRTPRQTARLRGGNATIYRNPPPTGLDQRSILRFHVSQWLPHTTGTHAGSLHVVPHTTVSPSDVPHTTVSASSVPHTTVSASSVPHT